ncbi:MAG: glycosyltransferase family 1 protein [Elusimicrobiota bacterium]|jgi:glycosyltransferase involved in cell wall biosynthesis
MMNVAISVGVNLEGARGIPLFQGYLARNLAQLDHHNRYRLFGYFFRDFERKKTLISLPDQDNFTLDIHRWPESLVNPAIYRWDLPIFWPSLKASGVNLFHSTSMLTPRLPGIKTVTTVHDIMPMIFPQWVPDPSLTRHYRRWLMRADQLICVSRHTRKDIVERLNIPEDKCVVIPQGVDTDIFHPQDPGADLRSLRQRYKLPERYILGVGPLDPRHNLALLIPILKGLIATPEGRDISLVIGGARSGTYEQILKLARSAGLEDRVCFPGYVPIPDLVGIYHGAEVFIYPSLYEGFGHPPLEALACGSPVVSSDSSALPEILEGCASLVAPQDVPGFIGSTLELLRDPGLRQARKEAGIKRAASLTWRRTTERILAVYKEVHSR